MPQEGIVVSPSPTNDDFYDELYLQASLMYEEESRYYSHDDEVAADSETVPIQNISKGPKQPRSPKRKSTAQGSTAATRKSPRLDSIPHKKKQH